MVGLCGLFSKIGKVRALVAGDLMLDTYTVGAVERISPEAPVPVLHVGHQESLPGGAGNVALNLVSLGAEVSVLGRVGKDQAGVALRSALSLEGMDTSGVKLQDNYQTSVKNRIIASNQQMVRVDHEQVQVLDAQLEKELIHELPEFLEDIDVVAISDYGKGFLTLPVLDCLISTAIRKGIPVIVDPKGGDYGRYRGCTVIKPNRSEARLAAGLADNAPWEDVAQEVLSQAEADYLVLTRSEEGISIFDPKGEHRLFPAKVREVKDVTGAGDTVLATLTSAVANGLNLEEAVQLSNVAAGIAVERLGCVRVTLAELARRLLAVDTVNKVFNEEHLFALRQSLENRRYVVLGVQGRDGLAISMYKSIKQLASRKDSSLVIYVADEDVDPAFVQILSSLNEVDFIILKGESLRSLWERISPEEVHMVDNGGIVKLDHPEELLA